MDPVINRIVINADDFGLKASVNRAIVDSFNRQLIDSTTIMANMPGFDEAIDLAHTHHLTNKIGVHLNIDEGHFITSDTLTTMARSFETRKNKRDLFLLSKDEKHFIYKEFSAQIERVRKAGISITHIDTHHHMHEVFPITKILLALLRKYKIPSMRILNNLNTSTAFHKLMYRKLVNRFIKMHNAHFSDFFGNQLEVMSKLSSNRPLHKKNKFELMVHPDYNNSGIIVDKIKNQEFSFEHLEQFKKDNFVEKQFLI